MSLESDRRNFFRKILFKIHSNFVTFTFLFFFFFFIIIIISRERYILISFFKLSFNSSGKHLPYKIFPSDDTRTRSSRMFWWSCLSFRPRTLAVHPSPRISTTLRSWSRRTANRICCYSWSGHRAPLSLAAAWNKTNFLSSLTVKNNLYNIIWKIIKKNGTERKETIMHSHLQRVNLPFIAVIIYVLWW